MAIEGFSAKKDVLTRLDSLVTGSANDELDASHKSVSDIFAKISRDKINHDKPTTVQGILKRPDSAPKLKRKISFPDFEELHEVIGYGGDVDYSSDEEEEERSFASRRNRFLEFSEKDDEMTLEEKNVINLTRKNTTFNSHAPNLMVDPEKVEPVKLGCVETKSQTPLITVRPFVKEHTPGKVNVVSPMRNGEILTSFGKKEEDSGRGEVKNDDSEKISSCNDQTSVTKAVDGNSSSEESGLSDGLSVEDSEMMEGKNSPVFSETFSDENEMASTADEGLNKDGQRMTPEQDFSMSSESDFGEASNEGSSSNSSTAGDEETKSEKNKSVDEEEVCHHGKEISDIEPTCDRCDDSLTSCEISDDARECEIPKPKVKITRKSPYVVGPPTAILKGTPKPCISIRKPPVPKDKPKVPIKPGKLLQHKLSPLAAPRKSSFTAPKPAARSTEPPASSPVKSRADSEVPAFECYTANADVQNAVIIDVCGTNSVADQDVVTISSSSIQTSSDYTTTITTSSVEQMDSATKHKEALEAIKKSLSNKLAEVSIVETNADDVDSSSILTSPKIDPVIEKKPLEQTLSNASSNFELNRATIASALEFNRNDRVARPSTKRQAPKPPEPADALIDISKACDEEKFVEPVVIKTEDGTESEVVVVSVEPEPSVQELPSEPIIPPPPPAPPMPKSALSAGRQSSMKSSDANSPKAREVKNRVQFSPETTTVTLPPSEDRARTISYNRWMFTRHVSGDVMESSFTGQPINVPRPPLVPVVVTTPMPQGQHSKRNVTYAPMPEDEVRRWTEKKNKQRSKSLPRGSEIDEIIGSSKFTKTASKLFSHSNSNQIRRQSRVELYETERKQLSQQLHLRKGKFSIKKFFKIGFTHTPYGIQFPPGNDGNKSTPPQQNFLDKEHEREILERERSRLRPEIIHPVDLQSAGVEVVCITPRGNASEKNSRTNKAGAVKTPAPPIPTPSTTLSTQLSTSKGKVDYVDSKDSGHETSSIHTENSETSTPSTSTNSETSTNFQKSVQQVDIDENDLTTVILRSKGKAKPVPPPRSHSLETFGKKSLSEAPCEQIYENFSQVKTHDESELEPEKSPTSLTSESSDGLPPHESYIQPGKMKIGNTTSVPALNTIHHSFASSHKKYGSTRPESYSGSFSFSRSGAKLVEISTDFGSEPDSERESISPPRSNPHDENHDEDDHDTKVGSRKDTKQGLSRLSLRKGRSVVHKNLEDNYGAVISANHEALAQILEQASHRRSESSVKGLSQTTDFKLSDFVPSSSVESERVETKIGNFVSAVHSATKAPVSLLFSSEYSSRSMSQNTFSLYPMSTFEDFANQGLFANALRHGEKSVFVSILSRMHVESLSSFGSRLTSTTKMSSNSWEKEVSFVLLQIVNALKFLQAQGIEEIKPDLEQFLLVSEERDPHYRVVIVDVDKIGCVDDSRLSLCCTALAAMLLLFKCDDPISESRRWMTSDESHSSLPELTPSVGMFRTMAELLKTGTSIALNQVKSMLEYMLWGPSDISLAQAREQGLQRWLDLERATVLNNLIRTQGLWNIELTIYEEYHLLFLVQTCAKMLHEASLLFESEVATL